MKTVMIVALVCLNIALVLTLVYSVNEPVANAQARGNADYLMITGKVGSSVDAVYVLDLTQQKMLAFEPDPNRQYRLQVSGGRSIKNDFGQ